MGRGRVNGIGGRRKKIEGLGDSSLHWLIAQLAVETSIAPQYLIDLEPRMLFTIHRYVIAKNQQGGKRNRR